MCLCFAAHSQPWACSQPVLHTCAHSQSLAQACTHSLPGLLCCHSLAHLCTLSHTCTCSCTPLHTLTRALHTCACSSHGVAHLYTRLHTCAHSRTSLHTLSLPEFSHSLAHLCVSALCAHSCTLSPRSALWPSPGAVAHTLHVAPSLCSRTSLVPLPSPGRPCTLHTSLHTQTQPPPPHPGNHSSWGEPHGFTALPGGPLCVPQGWSHSPLADVRADAAVPQGPARDAARC